MRLNECIALLATVERRRPLVRKDDYTDKWFPFLIVGECIGDDAAIESADM